MAFTFLHHFYFLQIPFVTLFWSLSFMRELGSNVRARGGNFVLHGTGVCVGISIESSKVVFSGHSPGI